MEEQLQYELNDPKLKVSHLQNECELFKVPFCGIEKHIYYFYEYLFSIVTRELHEKKYVNEGVIFNGLQLDTCEFKTVDYNLDSCTDGIISFQLINGEDDNKTVVFEHPLSTSDILKITPENKEDSAVIQSIDSEIRVYYRGQVSILRGRQWNWTPVMRDLQLQIQRLNFGVEWSIFQDIFEFAYFELSVLRIGSTIVFFPTGDVEASWFAKAKKVNINLKEESEKRLLKNYLKYHDGAIVVDKDMNVVFTNCFLEIKDEIRQKVEKYSGSRRTSAACFSKERPKSYVITVSDDGPVHVFKEGKELENLAAERYGLLLRKNTDKVQKIAKKAEDMGCIVDEDCIQEQCPNCGKKYRLDVVRVSGFNDREEFRCEKCGTKLLTRSCYEIIPI